MPALADDVQPAVTQITQVGGTIAAADLVSTLQGPGPFKAFAPSFEASADLNSRKRSPILASHPAQGGA